MVRKQSAAPGRPQKYFCKKEFFLLELDFIQIRISIVTILWMEVGEDESLTNLGPTCGGLLKSQLVVTLVYNLCW